MLHKCIYIATVKSEACSNKHVQHLANIYANSSSNPAVLVARVTSVISILPNSAEAEVVWDEYQARLSRAA